MSIPKNLKIKMPIAYILVGVPGSGKSTWAKSQSWYNDCSYISTDQYVDEYAVSNNKTYRESFAEYMDVAIVRMLGALNGAKSLDKDIIWDQTSASIKSRAKKINMLNEYRKIAVVFRTPAIEELMRRIDSRVGKDIPAKVILDMIENWEEPTHEEGFEEIWYA